MTTPSNNGNRAIRVLLVPDVPYWICDTIARAYVQHNPEIDAQICCGTVLRSLPQLHHYLGHFDLVHFLTPHDANKSMGDVVGRVATITTIHHIQDEENTRSVALSDGVMTASTQWYERLSALGIPEAQLSIVPYGVDTTVFHPRPESERGQIRTSLGIAPDAFVVGFVGKRSSDAHGRKGTDVFLRGIKRIQDNIPTLAVLLVGPGWGKIVQEFSDVGVACVHKPFIVDESAFAEVYAAMDVYWCTSTIEGGPVPVLESMASGVCCLATDVGMVSDVILAGQNGFILPFDDDLAFAEQTMALANDLALCQRIAEAGATRIRKNFDWTISARQIVPLYEKALANFAKRETPATKPSPAPWPIDWVAQEEARLTERFLHDTNSPPSSLVRTVRKVTESRWIRRWTRRPCPVPADGTRHA